MCVMNLTFFDNDRLVEAVRQTRDAAAVERRMAEPRPPSSGAITAAAYAAARCDNLPALAFLTPWCEPDVRQALALWAAAERGDLTAVRTLLPATTDDNGLVVALEAAAQRGHLAIVQTLLPRCIAHMNKGTALTRAARAGHADVAEALLPFHEGTARMWALHEAVEHSLCEGREPTAAQRLIALAPEALVPAFWAMVEAHRWEAVDRLASLAGEALPFAALTLLDPEHVAAHLPFIAGRLAGCDADGQARQVRLRL